MPYNQVLAQPVTNFYRGKAMRAAAGQAEQQSKLGDLAIERAELENAAMKNPQVDPLRELQIIRESAEVGRDMEAQGLMQYMEEVETLGEEKAQENATERLRRNQRVMKRINPNFEPLEKDTVWTLAGAKSAIMNADKVSDYLTGPGPDAPTTREVKIGEEVVTEEWRGGMWQEVGRAPRKEGVTVNVGGPVETKAEEEFGRLTGTAYSTVIDRGLAASEKAGTLRAMRENPAITGPTQDVRAAANALFSDLGIPIAPDQINQIANLSQYKGMVNQLVLIEQLKQKGPQTESDAKRIAESFGKTVN